MDAFAGPTLFLDRRLQHHTDHETLRRAHMAHFKHPTVGVVPKAGHFMFNDQPEVSVAVVRAFCVGGEGRRAAGGRWGGSLSWPGAVMGLRRDDDG